MILKEVDVTMTIALLVVAAAAPAQKTQFLDAVRAGRAPEVKAMLAAEPSLVLVTNDKGTSAVSVAMLRLRDKGFVPRQANEVLELILAREPALDRFEAAALATPARLRKELDKDPSFAAAHNSFGWTALHFAAFAGNADNAALLLERGAALDDKALNQFRNTPLQVAMLTGQEVVVRLLIARGADVRARQDKGFTPLHEAAVLGNEALISLLLDKGAEVNAASEDGATPLDAALGRKHQAAIKLLQAHGARAGTGLREN
jgi:hypothetical protein